MSDSANDDGIPSASFSSSDSEGEGHRLTFKSLHDDGFQRTSTSIRELLPEAPRVSVSIDHTASSDLLSSLQPLVSLSLVERLAGDVAVAAGVTAATSPFLTVVDKALVQRAAGSHTILHSARLSVANMLSSPVSYLRSPTFLWMWITYASTYSAANCLRTLTEQKEYMALSSNSRHQYERQKKTTTATLFVGTTLVNSSASLVKDRAYAQLFGSSVATSVPAVSYALWMARDLTVIGSSFILPTHVSRFLQEHQGLSEPTATKLAQVGTPMAAQLIAGPLHFVGLDCFNRPLKTETGLVSAVVNRAKFLKTAVVEVVAARMLRILPGYGVAGVYNTQLRNQYRNYLIENKIRHMMESTNATGPARSRTIGSSNPAIATRRTGELVALIRAKSVRFEQPSPVTQQPPST